MYEANDQDSPFGNYGNAGSEFDFEAAEQEQKESFGNQVGIGFTQASSMMYSAAEAVGEAVDSDLLADWGADGRYKKGLKLQQMMPDNNFKFQDIDDFESSLDWGKQTLGRGIAMLAPAVIGGIAGTLAAPVVGVGAVTGGVLGAAVAGMPLNIGETQEAIKALNPDAENPAYAIGAGIINTGLDTLGAVKVLSPLLKKVGKDRFIAELTKVGASKEAAKGFVSGLAIEAATEATQQAVSYTASHKATDTALEYGEQFFDEIIESAAAGGLVGGTLGGGGSLVTSYHDYQMSLPEDREKNVLSKAVSGANNWLNKPFRSVSDKLRKVAKERNLPQLNTIADKFDPDTSGKTRSATGFGAVRERVASEYRGRLNSIRQRAGEGGIDALFKNEADTTQETSELAMELRALLNDMYNDYHLNSWENSFDPNKAVDDSMIGYIDNYSPHEFNTDLHEAFNSMVRGISLTDKQNAAINEFKADEGLQVYIENTSKYKDAHQYVEAYIKAQRKRAEVNMQQMETTDLEGNDAKAMIAKVYGQRPAQSTRQAGEMVHSRFFADLPQATLDKFSSKRTKDELVDSYIDNLAHDMAGNEVFGTDGYKINQLVAEATVAAREQIGDGKNDHGILMEADIKDIYNQLDAMNGNYGERSASGAVNQAVDWVKAIATFTMLPLTTLTSTIELLNAVAVTNGKIGFTEQFAYVMRRTAHEAMSAAGMVKGEFHTAEQRAALIRTNTTLQSMTGTINARIDGGQMNLKSHEALNKFFKGIGLLHWTQFMREYQVLNAERVMEGALGDYKASKAGTQANRRALEVLNRLGIDANNPPRKGEVDYQERIDMAGQKLGRSTILVPEATDVPLWASSNHPAAKLFTHFMRYPITFSRKVFPALANNLPQNLSYQEMSNIYALTYMLSFGMLIAYTQDELKKLITGNDKEYESEMGQLVRVSTYFLSPSYTYLHGMIMAQGRGIDGTLTPAPVSYGLRGIDNFVKTLVHGLEGDTDAMWDDAMKTFGGLVPFGSWMTNRLED